MSDAPMYLDRAGAAKAAGVSIDTIARAINTGALRAKRTGKNAETGEGTGKYLISRDALSAWFSQLEDA